MTGLWQAAVVLAGILVLVSFAALMLGHLAARRHFAKPDAPPLPGPAPDISLLKPVEGAGSNTHESFASFCRVAYPGNVELLIGTIRADDPIVAVARRLQADFPSRKIRLVFAELKGANRKTSIMEALWKEASGQFLLFSDADVVAPENYLLELVPALARPQTGCVTCLPRGIQARTMGGRMIALHYGFNYLPQWMLARQTTGIHWAIGHTMAVPRKTLARLSGFNDFLNHLADDYELGHRVSRLGLKVRVAPLLLDCVMPAESFGEAFRRMQRWKRTIRRSRGAQFIGVALTFPVFWALVLAALEPSAWRAWATAAGVILVRWLLAADLQRAVKMPDWPRAWWLLPVVDVVEAVTFFGAFFGKTVYWAGRRYYLHRDGTLELAGEGGPAGAANGMVSTGK